MATSLPRWRTTSTPVDLGAAGERRVDIGLERDQFAAAHAAVGGDDEAARAILDPAVQRLGREAAEDDAVDRADPRAGEHRHRRFRDHRQIEGDAVALAGAQRLEAVRHPHHLGVQFAIGERARSTPGSSPSQTIAVSAERVGEMPVDAIVTEVENAVLEPFDIDRIVGPVGDPRRRRHPVDPPRLLGPEAVRIVERARVERFILLGGAVGAFEWRRRGGGMSSAIPHSYSFSPGIRYSPASGTLLPDESADEAAEAARRRCCGCSARGGRRGRRCGRRASSPRRPGRAGRYSGAGAQLHRPVRRASRAARGPGAASRNWPRGRRRSSSARRPAGPG